MMNGRASAHVATSATALATPGPARTCQRAATSTARREPIAPTSTSVPMAATSTTSKITARLTRAPQPSSWGARLQASTHEPYSAAARL